LVSRDVLAATIDYYDKKRKAKNDIEHQQRVTSTLEYFRKRYNVPASVIINTADDLSAAVEIITGIKYKFKLPSKNRLNKQHTKVKRDKFGNDTLLANKDHYELIKSVKYMSSKAAWDIYTEALSDINIAVNDLTVQDELESTYTKGHETSYGESGTVDDLLESYGVKVKRQDGSVVLPEHITNVQSAMAEVYSIFGNRLDLAKRTNLKISHAGDKFMHARDAVGIYTPRFNTIGVTSKHGLEQFGLTIAHEFAHFIDHQLGKTKFKHHISDDPNHITFQIATTIRHNMKGISNSKYVNRTCECFARALEQYFAVKTGSSERYDDIKKEPHNPTNAVFAEKVQPLIEQFFKENDHLLKSLRLTVVETFEKLHND